MKNTVPNFTPDTSAAGPDGTRPSMAARYLAAPFTVLDARSGWWRDRKQAWLQLGIESERGRAGHLVFSSSAQPPEVYKAKNEHEARVGRKVTWPEFTAANPGVVHIKPGKPRRQSDGLLPAPSGHKCANRRSLTVCLCGAHGAGLYVSRPQCLKVSASTSLG